MVENQWAWHHQRVGAAPWGPARAKEPLAGERNGLRGVFNKGDPMPRAREGFGRSDEAPAFLQDYIWATEAQPKDLSRWCANLILVK